MHPAVTVVLGLIALGMCALLLWRELRRRRERGIRPTQEKDIKKVPKDLRDVLKED